MVTAVGPGEWVLLAYRMPREPSTPRIAVWRALRRLGASKLGDGLVALPLGARNREQLEWVAERVTDAGGEARLWVGRPASRSDEAAVVASLQEEIAGDYRRLIVAARAAASLDGPERRRTVQRLRRELRRIRFRDHFPPPEVGEAVQAVEELGDVVEVGS